MKIELSSKRLGLLGEYDLFVGACGSDERAYECLRKLRPLVAKSEVIMFDYKERSSVARKSRKYFSYRDLVPNATRIPCSIHDTTCNMRQFVARVASTPRLKRVGLDISVFTKPYFLAMMKAMRDFLGIEELDLFYTVPSSYLALEEHFDRDERKDFTPIEIPGYSGMRMSRSAKLLILLLGFDGGASNFIWDELQPTATVPINGFPSYFFHYKDTSLLKNKLLLEKAEVRKAVKFAPADDPFETYKTIEGIVRDYPRHAVSIVPLGTKAMTLGAGLYALDNPQVRIAYPLPSRAKSRETKECGKSWLFRVNLARTRKGNFFSS